MCFRYYSFFLLVSVAGVCRAQSDQHYTQFMFNKLLYNPAYAGSRDVASLNLDYRDQWEGIDGAPKTANITIDAPVGSFMKPFRKVAVGLSATHEQLGGEQNSDIKAYYAYRIRYPKFIVSFGLSGGIDLYSANYSKLNLYQPNDPNFAANVNNAVLPNSGAGVYVSSDNYYYGLSVPNLLQDAYDKKEVTVHSRIAQEVRGYYADGGYVYPVNETIKLEPQVMLRYTGNSLYHLPFSADLTISGIYNDRFMAGITWRTDKSIEAIVHIQATARLNIGYAYDYLVSGLNGYSGGTHELVLGYDIIRENSRYLTPRFIKKF